MYQIVCCLMIFGMFDNLSDHKIYQVLGYFHYSDNKSTNGILTQYILQYIHYQLSYINIHIRYIQYYVEVHLYKLYNYRIICVDTINKYFLCLHIRSSCMRSFDLLKYMPRQIKVQYNYSISDKRVLRAVNIRLYKV